MCAAVHGFAARQKREYKYGAYSLRLSAISARLMHFSTAKKHFNGKRRPERPPVAVFRVINHIGTSARPSISQQEQQNAFPQGALLLRPIFYSPRRCSSSSCLLLQLMHKRVTGRAFKRATPISSPQSSQIPYEPSSMRCSAA